MQPVRTKLHGTFVLKICIRLTYYVILEILTACPYIWAFELNRIFLDIAKIEIAFKSKLRKFQKWMHAIISEFISNCFEIFPIHWNMLYMYWDKKYTFEMFIQKSPVWNLYNWYWWKYSDTRYFSNEKLIYYFFLQLLYF